MGFWDKLKSFFGVGRSPPEPPIDTAPPPSPPARGSTTPAASGSTRPDRYENSEILGLGAEELRRRALRIAPWRTAFIGRVDIIPPQSDERTAIIDRGLLLRGLLTAEQLERIHEIGDLWLRHRDAITLADVAAKQSAEAALEALRAEKERAKAEKKRRAAEAAAARAAEVARRRAEDIVFLGAGVSACLSDRRAHVERLAAAGLPLLASPADVARALGIAVPRLRWLCYHSDAAERTHYVHFEVPKRSGGMRLLSAPHARLAAAQAWVLENILARLPVEPEAHGFVPGRSTASNARPHVGSDLVVNLDLSDFFPSISWRRVRGVFARLGYSPSVATVLALLCTEAPRRAVELDGKLLWVALGERALPQGACTSPALSNLVARRLDRRLRGMAGKHGWRYTRYADDLTFSAGADRRAGVAMLLARVRHIVAEEGFAVNPRKGRVQRASGRQTVTGIVVNQRLGLPRDEVRRLRAILHGARRHGLESQNRAGVPHFEAHLRGKLAYLMMVDRARGAALLAELDAIAGRAPR